MQRYAGRLRTDNPGFHPLIQGTAEPSTRLKVIIAGAIYDTEVDENASWSIDLKKDPPAGGIYRPNHNGYNEVFLLSLGSNGQHIKDLSNNEVLIDLAPPKTPRVTQLQSEDTTPVLTGFADPYGLSSLSIAGATYSLAVKPDGNWALDLSLASPASGRYLPVTNKAVEIAIRTIDQAGNTSVDLTHGELTFQLDSDLDGIANISEGWRDSAFGPSVDTDIDGIPDYLDHDSDNDGLPDSIEAKGMPHLEWPGC